MTYTAKTAEKFEENCIDLFCVAKLYRSTLLSRVRADGFGRAAAFTMQTATII